MASVQVTGEIGAGVDEVWALVGDFAGFVKAMGLPVEVEGEGIGALRTLRMGPGEPMVERLEDRDEDAKRLVYAIVSGSMPLVGYVATMQLSDAGGGRTTLDWSSTFEPAEGTSTEDAEKLVRSIYDGGIAGLQGLFGA